jgi:hypothetical protein
MNLCYLGNMTSWPQEVLARLPQLLTTWLRGQEHTLEHDADGVSLVLRTRGQRFVIEISGSDRIASLASTAAQPTGAFDGRALLVVPYMGPSARAWAAERDLAWVDLSGNAEIHTPGLHIHAEGHPNRYANPGRPSHAFTPRYSRVPRLLLVDAARWWRQHELATEADLPAGTVSKVVRRLDEDGLLERDAAGALRARDPSLLLDAWAQHARFEDHHIRRFHAVGRSGADVLKRLADKLTTTDLTWAATGLAAAWQYTTFADFRIATIYVDRSPRDLEALGLREVERGENVWLVVPRDAGVFSGRQERGCWCVHPVQVYLDLLGHPERAREAADALRAAHLTWDDR